MRIRTASVAGGIGGAVAAALAAGWIGAALLITLIVVPTTAVCWLLADRNRAHRLVLLVTTWRQGIAPARRGVTTKPRRAADKPSATN